MEPGTKVIFYSALQRTQYPNDEQLFNQETYIGQITAAHEDSYDVTAEGFNLASGKIPKEYVRAARQLEWYTFWRARGFHKSLWGYIVFIIIFLVFLK